MLHWRLLLGTLIIAAMVLLCWVDYHARTPGVALFPLAMVVAVLGVQEAIGLLGARPPRPLAWPVYCGVLATVGLSAAPLLWSDYPADCPVGRLGWPLIGLAMGLLLVLLGEMRRYTAPGDVIEKLSKAVFAMVYVGLPLAFAVQLRMLGDVKTGLIALVSMIAVVKMSDIGQYTVGRLIGKHKLAPVLSPGKTWEGAAGGLAFAALTAWLLFCVLMPRLDLPPTDSAPLTAGWLIFAVLVAAAGVVGDLAESLLKRDSGRKDSSTWMPGFGGVLDILDSILAASPVAYLCWVTNIVGVAT